MTVPFPLDAFDTGQPVMRRKKPAPDRSRPIAIAVTAALHVAIVAGALSAVHVAHRAAPHVLMVQITPEKQQTERDVAPAPPLTRPTMVTVPMPEVAVQTPAPAMVQPAAARPVPPPPLSAPQKAAGESRQSFLARLLAQLNRFKQYPRAARQARIEGVVMLHFVMNAQGKVTSFAIAKSSGRPVLDAEALALIQRAQPLPAIPPDYPDRTLDAVVPIEFSLNR